jgi:hypothetical protein
MAFSGIGIRRRRPGFPAHRRPIYQRPVLGDPVLGEEAAKQRYGDGHVVDDADDDVRPPDAIVAGHPERLGGPVRRQQTEGEVPSGLDEPRQAGQASDEHAQRADRRKALNVVARQGQDQQHAHHRRQPGQLLYTNQNVVLAPMLAAAEAGIAANGHDSLARHRLTQMRDFLHLPSRRIPALLDRWHEQSLAARSDAT